MVKAAFINKVKAVFEKLNKIDKKYAMVWLTKVDYGGLIFADDVVVNVQMANHINAYSPEIDELVNLLAENLDDETNLQISHVKVYNDDDKVWIGRDDIILQGDLYNTAA